MSNRLKLITGGFIKNNPTFVLLLGMCPTLATTTSAINGMSMGLATLFVLVLSNMAISALIGTCSLCPGQGPYPGLHCRYRDICDTASIYNAGLHSCDVRDLGALHSAYRCELYSPWPC